MESGPAEARFLVDPEMAVAFVARVEQLLGGERAQIVEVRLQRILQGVGRLVGIVVGAADRFGDDFVHDPEPLEMIRTEFERFGGLGRGGAVFPQNGRSALG